MNKIDTSTWKEFRIGELFDVRSSQKKFNACDVEISDVGHPYVVRTSANNGIRGYINEDPKYLNDGNTISFGQDTATMFYQEKPYFTGDKIKILQFKLGMFNDKIAQFFLTVMRKAFCDFSWGTSSFDEDVIKGVSIYLPVTEVEEIDFEYMEARIKELEEARIKELEEALRVIGLHDTKLTEDEEKIISSSPVLNKFRIGDLFTQERGKEKAPKQNAAGSTPLISETNQNNGFIKCVKPTKVIAGNCITVSINYAETVFYQEDDFCASVNIAILRNQHLTRRTGLYIASVLSRNNKQYDYSNKISKDKLNDTEVYLPATKCGMPDYDYMERYIKAIEKLTVQKLYDDKGILIDATKKIV